jgi:DDE family transposase
MRAASGSQPARRSRCASTISRGPPSAKPIPYGVYDMARNEAWVSVGRDHDTPAFAVASIRQWWTMMAGIYETMDRRNSYDQG